MKLNTLLCLVLVSSAGFCGCATADRHPGTSEADVGAKQHFEDYLNQCGVDEVRCLWFLQNNPRIGMVMTIGLRNRTVFTVRNVYNWAEQASHTKKLDATQVLALKQILKNLPPSDKSAGFVGSVFVSLRKDDKPTMFQYDRRHIPTAIRRIYDIGGGYLQGSETTNSSHADGSDTNLLNGNSTLQNILKSIEQQIPELASLGIRSGKSLPDVVWNGEEVAKAVFILWKNPRYPPIGFSRARGIPNPDLQVTITRYAPSGDAQAAIEESLKQRQAALPPKRIYKGTSLYRYSSGGATAICQSGRYVIEVNPFSESAQPLTIRVLDVVLAEFNSRASKP